jgi:hypothetical protein
MRSVIVVFPASKFPELMSEMNEDTFLPVEPTVPVSLASDSTGVAGVVGVVVPSAFVEAGGAFGGGGGGIVPGSGGGTSAADAGWDAGAGPEPDILYVYLYFTQEFQQPVTDTRDASPVKNVKVRVCVTVIPIAQYVFRQECYNYRYKQ